MATNLAYVASPGTLKTMLDRIRDAILPERFTGDFVETILKMKGGTARSVVPFLKKMDLVSDDGIPTDLYREYRNKSRSGYAIANAMRKVYKPLFDQNDYVYQASDKEVVGYIVQLTGGDEKSSATKYTLSCFKILSELANFNEPEPEAEIVPDRRGINTDQEEFLKKMLKLQSGNSQQQDGINLSYTINLNLPVTTNIEVFNSIFKSLKEHLINL